MTAAEDTDEANDSVTLTHTPSGGGFSDSVQLPVTILDDEADPDLVLSETSLTVIEDDLDGVVLHGQAVVRAGGDGDGHGQRPHRHRPVACRTDR